jgi:NitT/TauT family transport system permease protein
MAGTASLRLRLTCRPTVGSWIGATFSFARQFPTARGDRLLDHSLRKEVVRLATHLASDTEQANVAPGDGAQNAARVATTPPTRARAPGSRAARPVWLGVLIRTLAPVLAGLILLTFWQIGIQITSVSTYLVPTPLSVLQSLISGIQAGEITPYALTTLQESLVGFLLGAVIALPIGYAVARSRSLAALLEPYLAASQAVPAVALAPLLVLWLGYGLAPVAALCALIVFFPVAINTTLGFRTIDRDVTEAARLDGAGWWALLRHIETPLALPSVLAGLRASLTLSVTGAVVGEFVLSDQGMGGLLTIARGNFDIPLEFATLFALAFMALALYGLARWIERLTIRYFALEA